MHISIVYLRNGNNLSLELNGSNVRDLIPPSISRYIMAGSDYSDKLRFCSVTASRSNLDRTHRLSGEEYRISNAYFSIYFNRNDVTVRSYRFFIFSVDAEPVNS